MSARILVVDDNPLNVKLLQAKLARDYYIVSTAQNGIEALAQMETEKPDIVLLDVMMPEMDGFETCKRIRANPALKHIPVIMITALTDTDDRVRGLEAGANDFLAKPINDMALMSRVRSLLRLKAIMDEWRMRDDTSRHFSGSTSDDAILEVLTGGKALVLEDDRSAHEFIAKTLASLSVQCHFVGTIAEAVSETSTGLYDLVYTSLDLKNEDGLLLCSLVRTQAATRQLPILLLGRDEETARVAKGLDLGANDYLMRPMDPNELLARTRTQLRHKRAYDAMINTYEQNMTMALVDPLTGAFNRRYLDAHLPRLQTRCAAGKKPLSILMIDIDFFKKVNDRYGHAAGDLVLKFVVNSLMQNLRPAPLVVRMGGEEFAIIMPETTGATAQLIAERLRSNIEKMSINLAETQPPLSVTVSIGISSLTPESGETTATPALERADAALYKAKETGRNRVVWG